jgi:nucleotide-binding universal stress UspA family protein
VQFAVNLAEELGARLTLAHVWEVPPSPYMPGMYTTADYVTPLEQAAAAQLANVVEPLKQRIAGVSSVLRMGQPWEEILAIAQDVGADLIVMGSHGYRGVTRVLLGSVAERVTRLSHVPVMIVPTQAK